MNRILQGTIVLPENTPTGEYPRIRVEVRDVSVADAPSIVVAATELQDVTVGPGTMLAFELPVPEQNRSQSLSVRVHVSRNGSLSTQQGDLVSTASYPVAAIGPVAALRIPVRVV